VKRKMFAPHQGEGKKNLKSVCRPLKLKGAAVKKNTCQGVGSPTGLGKHVFSDKEWHPMAIGKVPDPAQFSNTFAPGAQPGQIKSALAQRDCVARGKSVLQKN